MEIKTHRIPLNAQGNDPTGKHWGQPERPLCRAYRGFGPTFQDVTFRAADDEAAELFAEEHFVHRPEPEKIRTVRIRPFLKGQGPTLTVELYDLHRDSDSRSHMQVMVRAKSAGALVCEFEMGVPYAAGHAMDSDETVRSAVSFICSVDELSSSYHRDFIGLYGEEIGLESDRRFGGE